MIAEAFLSHLLSVLESLHQLNSPTFLTIHSFWSGMLRFSFKNGHVIQQRLTNLEKNMSRQPRSDHLNHDLVKDRFGDFHQFKYSPSSFDFGRQVEPSKLQKNIRQMLMKIKGKCEKLRNVFQFFPGLLTS